MEVLALTTEKNFVLKMYFKTFVMYGKKYFFLIGSLHKPGALPLPPPLSTSP